MCYSWLVGKLAKIGTIALTIAGLVVSAGSDAAVFAGQTSFTTRPASSSCGSAEFCFEQVDYEAGKCNYLTGINDYQAILGAYQEDFARNSCSGPYNSFAAAPSPLASGKPTGLPDYPLADFMPELPGSSNGSFDILLQGFDNGKNDKNLSTAIMVGSWQPGGSLCTGQTCGVSHVSKGGWTSISHGSCGVTQLMDINDSYIGVGYYEKSNGTTCTPQAFEYYPSSSGNGYEFHDFSPMTPSGGVPSSSEAISINQQGDVVGTMTWTVGSGNSAQTYTSGWLYADLGYYDMLCYPSCTNPDPTYALGINYNDDVVGYYTSSSGAFSGFITYNPQNSSPHFTNINDPEYPPADYTVVRAINTNCLIVGWTKDTQQQFHGFVGYPPSGCPGRPYERQRHAKTSRKS